LLINVIEIYIKSVYIQLYIFSILRIFKLILSSDAAGLNRIMFLALKEENKINIDLSQKNFA
jgi:hypothetical protein